MYYPLTLQFYSYNSSKYREVYIHIYVYILLEIYTHIYTNISMKRFHTHICLNIYCMRVFVCVRKKRDVPLTLAISSINCYRLLI